MSPEHQAASPAKPSYLRMTFRAIVFLFAPLTLILSPLAAIALWPESEYVQMWEIAFGVLALSALIAFFVTRSRK